MADKNKEKSKEARVKAEKNRLLRPFKDAPEDTRRLAGGLIERAAFQRIELEEMELDLKERGWTEEFRQSEKVEPYERARPMGQTYISLNTSYHKNMRQIFDMLPKKPANQSDGFEEFLMERDAM